MAPAALPAALPASSASRPSAARDPASAAEFRRNERDRWQCDLPGLARRRLQALGVTASQVNATLRRQGIQVTKIKKQRLTGGKKVTDKDITLFTRQLATMMKAGVPLLQAFDIVTGKLRWVHSCRVAGRSSPSAKMASSGRQ